MHLERRADESMNCGRAAAAADVERAKAFGSPTDEVSSGGNAAGVK